jgi:hypothetical protein
MSQYSVGGPLITLSEPGTSNNVPNINVTLFGNGEQPAGYVQPFIYNYIAPNAINPATTAYAVPDTQNATNVGLVFSSAVANNAGIVLAKTDQVTLKILTADDPVAGPTWTNLRDWRLVSRSAVPGEIRDDSSDHRRLGVAVSAIACDGRPIPLGDPRLGAGWHAPETDWRWTDGDAAMALPDARVVEITVAVTERYWREWMQASAPASAEVA